MKIVFTCGGTAGHINPALGVAALLRQRMPETEVLFIGAKGMMEETLVPREGFAMETVPITNIRRGMKPADIAHNLNTLKNVAVSTTQAKRLLRQFRPDVAIGTGGYVCYPVLKAAHSLHIPTLVHESNAVPGLTTKMLEKTVDRILVGFEEARENYRCRDKITVTGTPVRMEFLHADRAQARRELGIPEGKPLVVSVWGSLGARRMNEIAVELIRRACQDPFFCMIHSAGSRGYDAMCAALREQGLADCAKAGFEVRQYIYDMPRVMAAADLVLCRAGASTLAELTAMGKPAVLVPSPNVTNDHQTKNARVLEEAGAAVLLREGAFGADALLGTISSLLGAPEKLRAMSERMQALSVGDATGRIADLALELAGK